MKEAGGLGGEDGVEEAIVLENLDNILNTNDSMLLP